MGVGARRVLEEADLSNRITYALFRDETLGYHYRHRALFSAVKLTPDRSVGDPYHSCAELLAHTSLLDKLKELVI